MSQHQKEDERRREEDSRNRDEDGEDEIEWDEEKLKQAKECYKVNKDLERQLKELHEARMNGCGKTITISRSRLNLINRSTNDSAEAAIRGH